MRNYVHRKIIILIAACTLSVAAWSEPSVSDIRKEAEAGKATAQYHYGMMHLSGEQGVQLNNAEALKWLTRADDNGSVGAKYSLGMLYLVGQGVKKDEARALDYFKRAAKSGHAKAQYVVAHMYREGR